MVVLSVVLVIVALCALIVLEAPLVVWSTVVLALGALTVVLSGGGAAGLILALLPGIVLGLAAIPPLRRRALTAPVLENALQTGSIADDENVGVASEGEVRGDGDASGSIGFDPGGRSELLD